ncbi:amidohydrolase family protein [Pontibacter sp. SGAir0037]|uniref:N-acyl-D-amino-acid deacylase family protein n=1 Tax=Pontibacter sp. SGAir0037 TaxID=2571030 RepID=UPI0010CD17D9|nr:amidohydrolase family protein [Pontibacter sp. SGAir0037]QCR22101.1 N-acyl-D-amino acid deacylase [Pontibacter sp. SGAir0037]
MRYSLLIANASVIDGSGATPYTAHVLLQGDTIALIDKSLSTEHQAERTIDASGLVLTPGFIDAHAHGEPLEEPAFHNFLAMGITTICLGQDGFSPEHEDVRGWMEQVDAVKPGVNIAMFAGHNTIRMLSGTQYAPVPSEENFQAMERLLEDALDAGCFGLTTGLEYNPGYYAAQAELDRLAQTVGRKGGLIMSHMRSEHNDHIAPAIEELLSQGQYCPVQVSHIKVVYGKGRKRAEEILAQLSEARARGIQVTADFYPYYASYTSIEILFPEWAKKPFDYEAVKQQRGAELLDFLRNKIIQRNGPEATLIGSGPFKGKNLAQIAEERNKPFEEVLMHDIGPYGAFGAYFIMDEVLQETLIQDPYIMLCTDGSPGMNHPRSFGAFAKMLETYVTRKQHFPLEEAVRKMTGFTAETIGLADRGFVREGYKADLLLFNPEEVKENTTYIQTNQLATGFRYVLLNGELVKENEQIRESRAGRMLRK